jgi:hypothetical protein
MTLLRLKTGEESPCLAMQNLDLVLARRGGRLARFAHTLLVLHMTSVYAPGELLASSFLDPVYSNPTHHSLRNIFRNNSCGSCVSRITVTA